MKTIQVDLIDRSYPVHVGAGLLSDLGSLCASAGFEGKATIITGEPLWPTHGEKARSSLKAAGFEVNRVLLPDGEKAKTLTQIAVLYDALADAQHERTRPIIALGGGTVGDAAGFAAATYLRGVPLVQVPTTLLSQVDSAIGGKTGVNLKLGKNLVGAFWQPRLVLCDTDVLTTLPPRAIASGLAEVVKYGCIAAPDLLGEVASDLPGLFHRPVRIRPEMIARCVQIKALIVSEDEREGDRRRILNFGHTYAHAVESASGFESIMHGEAVALGMLVALELSVESAGLAAAQTDRVYGLLKRIFPKLKFPEVPFHKLGALMSIDKKVARGRSIWVLLKSLGVPVMQEISSLDEAAQAAASAQARWASA
jgi:3-dehydroquinate synthase